MSEGVVGNYQKCYDSVAALAASKKGDHPVWDRENAKHQMVPMYKCPEFRYKCWQISPAVNGQLDFNTAAAPISRIPYALYLSPQDPNLRVGKKATIRAIHLRGIVWEDIPIEQDWAISVVRCLNDLPFIQTMSPNDLNSDHNSVPNRFSPFALTLPDNAPTLNVLRRFGGHLHPVKCKAQSVELFFMCNFDTHYRSPGFVANTTYGEIALYGMTTVGGTYGPHVYLNSAIYYEDGT